MDHSELEFLFIPPKSELENLQDRLCTIESRIQHIEYGIDKCFDKMEEVEKLVRDNNDDSK